MCTSVFPKPIIDIVGNNQLILQERLERDLFSQW